MIEKESSFQKNNFNFVAEYTFFLVSWTSRKMLMYLLLRRSFSFFIKRKRRLEHHNCKTLNIRENISFKYNLFIFNLQSRWSQTRCSLCNWPSNDQAWHRKCSRAFQGFILPMTTKILYRRSKQHKEQLPFTVLGQYIFFSFNSGRTSF